MRAQPDYAARRARLRAGLPALGVRAVLVTDLTNVAYLCGFTGSAGGLLVSADPDIADVLATDDRYISEAAERAPGLEYLRSRNPAVDLAERAAGQAIDAPAALAVEEHAMTVAAHRALAGRVSSLQLLDDDHAVERLRVVKDEAEIDALRTACRVSVAALAEVLAEIRVGMTEREIAIRLERRMVDLGAEVPAFDTIVAAGPNSAVPHHAPGGRQITSGDLLKIDFGARVAGYHADCTRTVVVGEPALWQVELHALVAEAQQAGRDALAVGVSAEHVDQAARRVIAEAGHAEHFGHGLGHGVGLEIHEAPFLTAQPTALLQENTALTIEPGVYLPGRGGVRIEDTVLLAADGVQVLTDAPYELLRVG